MDTTAEKLYKIVVKENSHLNTKLNPDGSKAAIQFTDDGNALNGPVNLIEFNSSEPKSTEYIPVHDEPLTFKEIIWQDVIAPILREALYRAMMEGYNSLSQQIKTKAVPAIKEKSKSVIKDMSIIASGIKDGLAGKSPKALGLVDKTAAVEPDEQLSVRESQPKTVRTKEEVESIVQVMRFSTATLAACIRMLNNTVMVDDGTDPRLRLEIQRNIQTLSSSEVKQHIDLLLEEKNSELLDEVEYAMLFSFREGYFLINGAKVPVARYLDA